MDAPPVQYVTTSDGYNIAYAVSGSGEPLAFLPVSYSHLQLNWSHSLFVPSRRPILEALVRRFCVVQFDSRGQGMSSRGLRGDFAMEDYVHDLEAVLDRLALERVVILGAGGSSHNAIRYALVHPERVKALVLISAPMSLRSEAGFMKDLPTQNWEYFLHSQLAQGLSPDEVGRGIELIKQTTNQGDFLKTAEVWTRSEIGDSLPRLHTPTLVMHPRDFLLVLPDESMQVAAKITNAQMVMIEGASIYGDAEQAVEAIEIFVAGLGTTRGSGTPRLGRLSSREVDVLRLLALGKSNAQIAEELVISQNTVIRHVSNIFAKIGAANRAEAAAYATRNGLA
jgi:pimeloyl-ACP methyl ester carboxylesterase/DNA-binding CsgD family transcriptional regulator